MGNERGVKQEKKEGRMFETEEKGNERRRGKKWRRDRTDV